MEKRCGKNSKIYSAEDSDDETHCPARNKYLNRACRYTTIYIYTYITFNFFLLQLTDEMKLKNPQNMQKKLKVYSY